MRRPGRLHLVLGLGLVIIVALFVREMSGRATRIADSNHISAPVFAATVPGGGTACQPLSGISNDVADVRLLIGTHGQPVPALGFRLVNPHGTLLADGFLPAGAHEGYVTIPVTRNGDLAATTEACLHVAGGHAVVLGGEAGPGGTEVVNGKRQTGSISLVFMRPGKESWWELLPTLDTRFGLGKASFFGDWTLPVMALLLVAVWIGSVRLLARERE